MQVSNIAKRYSQAIFEISQNKSNTEQVFKELKALKEAFSGEEINSFFTNPTVGRQDKMDCAQKIVKEFQFSEEVKSFLLMLAENNRLSILENIVEEFQFFNDQAHSVTRGEVTSSHVLTPEEREQIETIVSKKTNKRVILTYKEDPKLIGGLIAKVDGYTFDDTITMHLNRLNEDLKRRVH